MTNIAMKKKVDKDLIYWDRVFSKCGIDITKNKPTEEMPLSKMLELNLMSYMGEIGEIMNDAVNIHMLEQKLENIKNALLLLQWELKEQELPNGDGHTWLITGVSID